MNKQDDTRIFIDYQDRIAEYEKQIILETQKMNVLKRKIKEKQDLNKGCQHIWIYRRTHNIGWRYCKKCRIYENIDI